jgi:hypothetical protein
LQLDVRLKTPYRFDTGEDPTAIVATYFTRPDPAEGSGAAFDERPAGSVRVWLGGLPI